MRDKLYVCYETEQKMSKSEWLLYYMKEIDHAEYEDFSVWWHDMMRVSLLVEC